MIQIFKNQKRLHVEAVKCPLLQKFNYKLNILHGQHSYT